MKTLSEFFTRRTQGHRPNASSAARRMVMGVRLLIILVMVASPLLPSRQQLGTLLAVQPGDSALEAVSKTIASPIAQTFAPEEAAAASFVNWVPIVPSTYATSIDSSGRYGLCTFLNCFNNNPTRQTDSTLTNFNNLSILVGLLGGLYTKVDLGRTFPAGTRAGFLVDPGSGLLDLGIGTQIQVRTYTGNTLQETYTLGGLIDLSVFGSGSQRIVSFVTTQSYDQVEIRYGSLGGVFGDMDVFYPVVGYTSDQKVSKSVSASDVMSPSAPLVYTLHITNTGNYTATSVVVTDSIPSGLSGLIASNSFGVGNPALTAGSNAVWNIGTLAPNASGTILITATSPATNTLVINRSRIGSATADFNTLNNGSATVNTVLSGVCTDASIPPYIFNATDGASVVSDTAKTGTFGVCVNGLTCSVANPNNATSDGTTDFANLSVSLGLAAGARLTIDPGATYPAGVRAGFAVKPNSGLIDLSLLTGVRIKTYLSGTLQEDVATNGSLINLSLFGAGGERLISFKTTKAFDEIQVQTSSLVAALLDLRVHYGFIAFDAPVCGITGGIQVAPYSKNFGSVSLGLESLTQLITITNVGVAAGTVSGISLVGSDLSQFVALPTGTCGNIALITALTPVTLAAGASCNVPVKFVPLSVGAKTAALQVNADDGIAMRDSNGEILAQSSAIKTAKAVVGRVAMATSTTSVPLTGSALAAAATSMVVNTIADNTTAGDGQCTLREAMTNANGNSDTTGGDCLAGSAVLTDSITFSITGAGPHIIQPTSALPALASNVKIDGETQPGATCGPTRNLLIGLRGSLAGNVNGLSTATAATNVTIRGMAIYFFTQAGIYIDGGAVNGVNTSAVIECNNIGTDITGLLNRANDTGVSLWGANNNRIGTNGDGVNDVNERNIIAGNSNRGIDNEFYASNNVIAGNYIGLGVDGSTVIANGDGVFIAGSAKNNLVGTNGDGVNDAAERNIISGNGVGVAIGGGNVMTNVVAGNYIGTDATGTLARGNTGYGVDIYSGPTNNRIGGNAASQSNLIAFNSTGVVVENNSTNNAILGNSIYSNTNLGIDLNADGVTANDVGDGDTGPNGLLNFPVIQSVSGTTVNLTSDVPAGNYLLQIYDNPLGKDPTGYGEGQTLVYSGTLAITSGGMNHSATLASAPSNSGQRLAATLTQDLGSGSYGSTSEFGNQVAAPVPDLTTVIGQPSPNFVAGSASNVPMTVTNAVTAGTTSGSITTTMTLPNANFSAPASFSSGGNTCTTSGLIVTCVNPGPIAPGASNVMQVPVTPNASAVGTTPAFNGTTATTGETVTGNNTATPMTPSVAVAAAGPTCLLSNGVVTSNETDTNPLDNSASICVPIGASAPDLTTTLGQPTPAMVAGQSSSLPVTVTNGGAGPTTGPITTTITLPSGVTAPASFSSNGNTCTTSGSTVTCINPGPIANGSSNTMQIPVTPNVSTVGTQPVFNATTATPGETATGNNAATPLTTSPAVVAAPAPDLTTTLGQPAPALVAGSPSNIPVTVTNSGTGPTTGPVTTTMTLPAGVTAPATFSNNGWTCATSGSTVTCTNPGPIANGGNSAFTVPATPNVSTVGSTPAFNATTAPTAGETNTGNNAASPMTPTTAVVAGPTPDLTTAVGQPAPAFVAGAASNVPVTVTNAGTGPTTGPITTTMTLPTGTTAPAGFSSNGWSCATAGQTVTCTNAGPIAAGGSSAFNVPVTPNASTVGTQPVFNATTAPTAGETNTSNNAASPMTPATAVAAAPAPDLTSVIGQPSPNFVGGIASNVPMTVSNVGNAPTTGPITTTMTLPAGTSAPASFTNNGWSCTTSGQTVTCTNPGPIAAGSSSTVQVPVTAGVGTIGTTPGPFTGTVSPTAGETNTGNNNPTNMTPNAAVVAAPAAPVAPTINTPTDSSSITNTQPVISGIGTPGALITVTESPTGTVLCTTTVGAGSLWSCTPGTPLPAGPHTISAVAANNVGPSPASAPVAFTVDTVPPVAPAITSPAASSTVNDNTPLFSGTGEPGSTVAVKEGATTVCTAIVDGSGNWSCTPSSALPDGAHSVTATATDPAGNVGPPTAPRSFTVATLADLTTTIGNPQPALQATVPSTLPVTVNNIGVAPSSGPVTTTVSLPPGVTAPASFTSGPWTCTATTPPDAFTASSATCVSSTPIPVGGSSTINVPITPDPARVGSSPTFNATSAGGGEANTSNNAATPLSSGPVLPAIRTLPIKVFLHGPFQSATGIMSDGLRLRNLIPTAEPYASLGFARAGVSGETTTAGVLAVSGSSAVVDWVLVELRDLGNPATLITTRAALLLRNGFVKDVDGTSDLTFSGLTQSSYFVSVRHRNHLGAMTVSPVVLSASTALQDFTTMPTAQVHGSNARRTVGSIYTMWAGNANGDGKTQAAGASNDLSAIVSLVLNPTNGNTNLVRNYKVSGYRTTDVNMDGDTVAAGASNDVALVVNNVTANPVNQPGLNRNVTVDQRLP